MIYSLTANPAIDMNVTCQTIRANQVTRTVDAIYTPNGKGLNVSFVLSHFGKASGAFGFFGGFSGRYIVDESQKLGVSMYPVWVEGITRINTFVTEEQPLDHALQPMDSPAKSSPSVHTQEYKFVNAGAYITPDAEAELLKSISSAPALECLVISGSLPPGTSEHFLTDVITCVKSRGAEVVLDISSPIMKELLSYHPLLIKPNDDELESIFGLKVSDDKSAWNALVELQKLGARNILLTLGGKGAYYFDGDHSKMLWRAKPKMAVNFYSSACAGDATLGAFLSAWYEYQQNTELTENEYIDSVESAIRLCQAVGANVVEEPGLGTFGNVDKYLPQIEVQCLQ